MILNVMKKASVQCKKVSFFTRVEQSLNLQLGKDCVVKVKDVLIHIPPQALNAVRPVVFLSICTSPDLIISVVFCS